LQGQIKIRIYFKKNGTVQSKAAKLNKTCAKRLLEALVTIRKKGGQNDRKN
jgi:hypothetical protein